MQTTDALNRHADAGVTETHKASPADSGGATELPIIAKNTYSKAEVVKRNSGRGDTLSPRMTNSDEGNNNNIKWTTVSYI